MSALGRRNVAPVKTTGLTTNRPANACIIYVLGQDDERCIKIGKTRNAMEIRQSQHEERGPDTVPMRPLALLWGMDSDEKALKRHWQHLRIGSRQEWLTPVEELRAWVRFLKQQAFVAHTPDELETMAYVDSRHWLPGGQHRFAPTQGRFKFHDDPWSDLDLDDEGDGDFYTSPLIIDAARQAMGSIDLDPASCRRANTVVRAPRFFGALQDGLSQEWDAEHIWLNPPFNQWDIWTPKILRELENGTVEQMCVMLPTRSLSAKSNIRLLQRSAGMCVTNGRFKFWGPKAGSPDDGHVILYFGRSLVGFELAFASIGTVFATRPPHFGYSVEAA